MKSKVFSSVLYGWIFIFGFILSGSFILSFFLKFTEVEFAKSSWITVTISFIALFFGGLTAGIKNKEKGWFIGGLTGISFSVLIFLVQFLGFNESFTGEQLFIHLGFILLSILGGIFGVNLFVGKSS